MNNKQLTVVVPIYNVDKYLKKMYKLYFESDF